MFLWKDATHFAPSGRAFRDLRTIIFQVSFTAFSFILSFFLLLAPSLARSLARPTELVTSRQSSRQSWVPPLVAFFPRLASRLQRNRAALRLSCYSYSDSLFYPHPSSALNLAPVSSTLRCASLLSSSPESIPIRDSASAAGTGPSGKDSSPQRQAWRDQAATLISHIPDSNDSYR